MQEKDILLIGSAGIYNEKVGVHEFSGAIAYLVTYLTRQGYIVDYVNSIEDEYDRVVNYLSINKYHLIGISTTLCLYQEQAKALVERIKNITNTKIVLGGIFVAKLLTIMKKEPSRILQIILNTINADYYIDSYQGEYTLSKLLCSIKDNNQIETVPNIYYKSNNNYQFTFTETEDNNLEVNTVDWGLIEHKHKKGMTLPIRTSRSCPFNCYFCTYKAYSGKYKCISVEAVEKELDSVGRDCNDVFIRFVDDTFNIPIKRFKLILEMMIRNQYNFKWTSFIRCQYINDELAILMKKSGCDHVSLGIESGSQLMLDLMNKQVKVEELLNGIDVLKKNGIRTVGLFFLGFPGETRKTVQETLHFINKAGLDTYSVMLWNNEPLSPIYEMKEKWGLEGLGYNWSHNTMNSIEANDLINEYFK